MLIYFLFLTTGKYVFTPFKVFFLIHELTTLNLIEIISQLFIL